MSLFILYFILIFCIQENEVHLIILHIFLFHRGEHQACKKGLHRRNVYKAAYNQRRKTLYQPCLKVLAHHRQEENCRNQREHHCNPCKKSHRLIIFVQPDNRHNHFYAIRVGIELRLAARRPVPVLDNHILHAHIFVNRVDTHLRLDLKAL